jgi:hypothetical protein
MLRTGLYMAEDIKLMEEGQQQQNNILSSKISHSWQDGDPTLPAGWKIKR